MLSREDHQAIDALVRHHRFARDEAEAMRAEADADPELMASHRRAAAQLPDRKPKPRVSAAYLAAMADLERMGLKRRKQA